MPAALIIGGIGAAATIGGAVMGANASRDAANTQANAAMTAANLQYKTSQDTLALQKSMFDQGQAGLQPFRDVGTSAAYSLADLYGLPTPASANRPASTGGTGTAMAGFDAFRASPEYQIPFQQGVKAIEYSRAARGGLQNPGTADALNQFGQGYAGTRLDGYIGHLLQIAGIGGNAAQAGAGQATQQGNIMGNTMMAGGNAMATGITGAGQATASGIVGASNQYTSALGGIGNNLALYGLLNRNQSGFGNFTNAGYGTGVSNGGYNYIDAQAGGGGGGGGGFGGFGF